MIWLKMPLLFPNFLVCDLTIVEISWRMLSLLYVIASYQFDVDSDHNMVRSMKIACLTTAVESI